MNTSRFWLASNSPRRREILSWAGWPLEKVASDVDESRRENETAEEYVRRIALLKAGASLENAAADDIIISADTIVAMDGRILGKPKDAQDAVEMLVSMRSKAHWVMTAVAIRRAGDSRIDLDLCRSKVKMRDYSDAEIRRYVESGDPLDKAGAYAIQNPDFHPAEDFNGCRASVMGMPLCHLERLLRRGQNYSTTDWPAICQMNLKYQCPVTSRIMAGEEAG